ASRNSPRRLRCKSPIGSRATRLGRPRASATAQHRLTPPREWSAPFRQTIAALPDTQAVARAALAEAPETRLGLQPNQPWLLLPATQAGTASILDVRGPHYSGWGSSVFSFFRSLKLRSRNSRAICCPPSPKAMANPSINAPNTIENAAITVSRATLSSSSAMVIAKIQITNRIDQLRVFGDL